MLCLFVGLALISSVVVMAGRGFNPKYEADRAFRTALITSYLMRSVDTDDKEIDRLLNLPRYAMAYPTGELAKTQWIFVDESLLYAIEFDWRKKVSGKGRIVFDFTKQGSEK